ncbi:hypothetical protein SB48_HM08orf01461 [Heyndrickxia coagulans]|uniref:Uncharacterized protein n=1 Tax=Heyndrickxia coagulans TaxID=1398 RepID=A0AAN0WAF9_HEYCO|nr:hypothetical protein SB48_HM08orf01461 [Heyndrickxia coagulans]
MLLSFCAFVKDISTSIVHPFVLLNLYKRHFNRPRAPFCPFEPL